MFCALFCWTAFRWVLFSDLPIVVLSSLSSDDSVAAGMAAGATEYLIKMDKEQMIETCNRLMAAVIA